MTIAIDPGVWIPMPDGIALAATLYRSAADAPPGPAVFTLTPYTADGYYPRGAWFAGQGLTFLAVDTRGRGNSQGQFDPFRQELTDGHDIVEWIAAQPWCNGRVGMWGGSYGGMTQWATASRNPPHLATIVPTASAHAGVDFPVRNGISYQYLLQWLAYVGGAALQPQWFGDAGFWRQLWRERFERGASFRSLATELGGNWPVLDHWIDLIEADDHADFAPTDAQLARLDLPILTITGSYDDDQPGALAYYRRHCALASAAAAERHCLVIGPWDHMGTRTPMPRIGGLELGPASLIDMNRLHLEWYRWTMGEGPRPALLERRVAYYVMGAECWRHVDRLEQATARTLDWHLDSRGNANSLFASGTLTSDGPGVGTPDCYVDDPRDVSIARIEAEVDNEDPVEPRMALARDGRQLVYHSPPLEQPLEITGFFRLDAWLAIDTPDTDFAVRIYEVTDAGQAILLSADLLRARHRLGRDRPCLVTDPAPQLYRFGQFTFVSRLLARGSWLRLTIGPNTSIYQQRNFNAGGVVSDETVAHARVVTVTLFHDADHPSVLVVPAGREATP